MSCTLSTPAMQDSNRWATRDLQRSNDWACLRLEQLQRLQRDVELLEAAKIEAAEAAGSAQQSVSAELSQVRQELETKKGEAAEEVNHWEQQLHELREKYRNVELQLQQAQLQSDGPGIYILAGEVDVFEGVARGSAKVGRLGAGQEVRVLEVVHREMDRRVRGRIQQPAGWISLLDTSEGHRWAHRQLSATNEWVGHLAEEKNIFARRLGLSVSSTHKSQISADVRGACVQLWCGNQGAMHGCRGWAWRCLVGVYTSCVFHSPPVNTLNIHSPSMFWRKTGTQEVSLPFLPAWACSISAKWKYGRYKMRVG